MVIGVDTGFFIELKNNSPRANEIWNSVVEGNEELAVSVVSINEILVYYFKKGKTEMGRELLASMKLFANIALLPVSERIAEISASYRFGLGIPTIDSLILTTFIVQKCDKVVSTDADFLIAKKQGIIDVEYIEPVK